MDKFSNMNEPDDFVRSFIAVIGYLNGDVDSAYEGLIAHLSNRARAGNSPPSVQYLLSVSSLIIPDDQRDSILRTLKVSPASVDFILEPRFNNPFIAQSLLIGYYLTSLLMNPEKTGPFHSFEAGRDVVSDYHLYLIIRSLFISDLVN